MYGFQSSSREEKSKKRHFTLPIFDSDELIFGVKVPIHQSEADELKYVKTVLEKHSIPNAFEGLSIMLAKTKHKSVHIEIANFLIKCLDKPLEITECMKTEHKLTRSLSGDFDRTFKAVRSPRKIRPSVSMTRFQIQEAEDDQEDSQSETGQKSRRMTDDDIDDESTFLVELLHTLPEMIPNLTKDEQGKVLSKIPHIFISLAPDPTILNQKGIPKFVYFKAATQCATEILKLNNSKVIKRGDILQLGKMIIMASFTCSSNISDIMRMTKIKSSAFLSYIAASIPFIAQLIPFIGEDDNGLILLLLMFWLSIIVQTNGDMSVFNKYSKELEVITHFMPPLVSSTDTYGYNNLINYIEDVLHNLRVNLFPKRFEQFAEAFCKIAPTLAIKKVLSLSQQDIVLLLAIAVLEKQRASHGNLIPLFGYFDVDFYPEVAQCFDAITFPIFISFQTYVSSLTNISTIRKTVLPVLTHIFQNYQGRNPRIVAFFDKIIPPLITSQSLALCAFDTANAYLSSYSQMNLSRSSRLESFKAIGLQLFKSAATIAPNAFNAILHDILHKESDNIFTPKSFYLQFITEMYPPDQLLEFTHQLSMKQKGLGMLPYLTHRNIMHIENINDRLLLLALHYINCHNKTALHDLTSNADPQLLLMIWSHIVMVPDYRSQPFMQALASKFVEMATSGKGMFKTTSSIDSHQHVSNTESSKEKTKDSKEDIINNLIIWKQPPTREEKFKKRLEEIEYQSTVLSFFIEQINVTTYADEIMSVILSILNKDFIDTPEQVTSLIPLSTFIASCITVPKNSDRVHFSLVFYLLKSVMSIISLYSMPNIYKYLKESDVKNLYVLLNQFYEASRLFNSNHGIEDFLDSRSQVNLPERAINVIKKVQALQKNDPLIFIKLSDVICFILANEYAIFAAYFNAVTKVPSTLELVYKYWVKPRNYNFNLILPFFWDICPRSIPALCDILNVTEILKPLIPPLVAESPEQAKDIPVFIAKMNPAKVQICHPTTPDSSLTLLQTEILSNPDAAEFVKKCVTQFDPQSALLFIPQFVQSLKYGNSAAVKQLILDFCKKSDTFTHFLLWNIAAEKGKALIDESFQMALVNLEMDIFSTMNEKGQQHYDNELQFINHISDISAKLLPLPFDQRKTQLTEELKNLKFTKDLYVPSNPEYRILEIDAAHSVPLKSHSRVPILVRFKAQKKKEDPVFIGCIFKIEDDVRMDALMIQLIDRIYRIVIDSGIDCWLLPYHIYATGDQRGVIECIQNAKSRHEIGENTNCSLLKYFIEAYGQVGTPEFEKAQHNFIKSMAPYSLICYLFQVKDRHNANIMLDNEGHIIHIDFGFIFDISPGGNMKFEKAPFKLNNEMIELMGELGTNSPGFIHFAQMFGQCFLAVRSRIDEIEAIAYLMKDAGLPCFKADSFKRLRERLFLDRTGIDIQESIYSLVTSSVGAMTTTAYDAFQYAQNGIFYVK